MAGPEYKGDVARQNAEYFKTQLDTVFKNLGVAASVTIAEQSTTRGGMNTRGQFTEMTAYAVKIAFPGTKANLPGIGDLALKTVGFVTETTPTVTVDKGKGEVTIDYGSNSF
ncbi:MAG: hypothetical protein PHS02_01360, partial [Candidatus ainarchaeum sp.]|nr:hypothetical protein [Candidatus ainarchaeum sp.]